MYLMWITQRAFSERFYTYIMADNDPQHRLRAAAEARVS